VIDFSAY